MIIVQYQNHEYLTLSSCLFDAFVQDLTHCAMAAMHYVACIAQAVYYLRTM